MDVHISGEVEDITYCDKFDCKVKTCPRHYDNRKIRNINHSIADFTKTKLCLERRKQNGK